MKRFATGLCSVVVCVSAPAAELSGRVVDQAGKGVERAIVVVSTARPRVGPAVTCPSCYRDCTKRTLTDAEGNFTIEGLSSKLQFSLAAGGTGYRGTVSKHFDPAEDPRIELKLQPIPNSPEVAAVVGVVVDDQGNPVGGAEVRTRMVHRDDGRIGGDKSVTPLTLTDGDGNFQIVMGRHISRLDVRVLASGFAPKEASWMRNHTESVTITLGRGAAIRGRLLVDEEPLTGVELGLVQQNRTLGNIVTPAEVSTDPDGYFQFDQLPPDLDYTIYTHTGQNAKGVLQVSLIKAPGHGLLADLGDLAAREPHRLSFVVKTADGAPIPPKSVIQVGRNSAWRGSTLLLQNKPKAMVELADVSREWYQFSVRIPGHDVVRVTPSLNKEINGRYEIAIEGDTEVMIVVETKGAKKQPRQLPAAS